METLRQSPRCQEDVSVASLLVENARTQCACRTEYNRLDEAIAQLRLEQQQAFQVEVEHLRSEIRNLWQQQDNTSQLVRQLSDHVGSALAQAVRETISQVNVKLDELQGITALNNALSANDVSRSLASEWQSAREKDGSRNHTGSGLANSKADARSSRADLLLGVPPCFSDSSALASMAASPGPAFARASSPEEDAQALEEVATSLTPRGAAVTVRTASPSRSSMNACANGSLGRFTSYASDDFGSSIQGSATPGMSSLHESASQMLERNGSMVITGGITRLAAPEGEPIEWSPPSLPASNSQPIRIPAAHRAASPSQVYASPRSSLSSINSPSVSSSRPGRPPSGGSYRPAYGGSLQVPKAPTAIVQTPRLKAASAALQGPGPQTLSWQHLPAGPIIKTTSPQLLAPRAPSPRVCAPRPSAPNGCIVFRQETPSVSL